MTKTWTYRDLLQQIHLDERARGLEPIVVEPGLFATFNVMPMGAVRMNRRTMFSKNGRERADRYFAFKDAIAKEVYDGIAVHKRFRLVDLECRVWWKFYLPMPKSLSAKKRAALANTGLQKKPDFDNLVKAVYDAVLEEDSAVWDVRSTKLWSPLDHGFIEAHRLPF
jgi:Holliday junction resolvase RusA-like endonuclease